MSWLNNFCHRQAWIIFAIICLPVVLFANQGPNWVALLEPGAPVTGPEVRVLESDALRTVFEMNMPGFLEEVIEHEGVAYQKLTLLDNLAGQEVGYPELPVICASIGLPYTGTVSARVTYSDGETFSGYRVHPFLEPVTDEGEQQEFVINNTVYQQDLLMPEELVTLDGPHIWRDVRLVVARVTPFQYNPAAGELTVYR